MKQKISSYKDKYYIYDNRGKRKYCVTIQTGILSSGIKVTDMSGHKIGMIEHK